MEKKGRILMVEEGKSMNEKPGNDKGRPASDTPEQSGLDTKPCQGR
ncbi:hypothetical protein [Desulfonatronum thiodismutans]|nr:hypothetical protein [Desulfonatronum thiodismutans]